MELHYPADEAQLKTLGNRRQEFEKWFADLEAEHIRRGSPYGNHLALSTGVACWIMYFEDGYDPSDALSEDLSYD